MNYLKKFESYSSKFIFDETQVESTDKRGYDSIINLVSQNKINFDYFLDDIRRNIVHFGLASIETEFHLIGYGQYGIAFGFIDKVLKITTSESEFETCSTLVDLEFEGVVRYYLSFQYKNLPIWVIVQDKLKIPSKFERDIYTTLYYLGVNDMSNPEFKFKSKEEIINALKYRLKNPEPEDELPSYDVDKHQLRMYLDRYLSLADKLREQGITTDDLHGENIGKKEGQLIHFDVMIT